MNDAKKSGVRRALISGGGMGLVFFIMFACYALAFWYGAKLIKDEPENYTPGRMMIVSILKGFYMRNKYNIGAIVCDSNGVAFEYECRICGPFHSFLFISF